MLNGRRKPMRAKLVRVAALALLALAGVLLPAATAFASTVQLYAFGSNSWGQLGTATNSFTFAPNPTPARVTLPGATGPVTQVAGDWWRSLAVTSTGQLYAFGQTANSFTFAPNPTPALVTLPGATGPVTQVAAGIQDLASPRPASYTHSARHRRS